MNPEVASPDRKVRLSTWSRMLAIREVGSLAALVLMLLVLTVTIPRPTEADPDLTCLLACSIHQLTPGITLK